MGQKRNYSSTKRKSNASRRRKRKSRVPSVLFTFIMLAVLGAVLFVACKDSSSDSTDNNSSASNESGNPLVSGADTSASLSEDVDSSNENTDVEDSKDASSNVSVDDTSDVSVDDVGSEFSSVAWYKKSNGARYVSYAAKNPSYTKEQVVTYVNIGLDGAYYTNTYPASKEDGMFILVNKYSYVDRNFTPDNLVELDDSCKVSGKSVKLVKEAADAFARLSADAAKLEYCILGMSGYRTYAYQESLYNRYLQNDTQANVDTYSARPGYSEHHTGLALDVQTDTVSFSDFGQTKEYEWLLDNAHKYGFVIHYTYENQWITGYMPEEWHIRYLGVEAATYIYEHNLSVDEYLVMYGSNGPEAAG